MSKRLYPHNRVRYWYSYDIEEVCTLFDEFSLHPQTVRSWLKGSLKPIDSGRPILIHGTDLIAFLKKRNDQNKCCTNFNQFYCMKCQDARFVFQNKVYVEPKNNCLKVQGRCRECKSGMFKNYKMEALPELRKEFKLVEVSELYDCLVGSDNTHLDATENPIITESMQGSLF